jgi:hypothetical protein
MDENLIAINIPNGISILIMVAIGGLVFAFIRKLAIGKPAGGIASSGVFSNA